MSCLIYNLGDKGLVMGQDRRDLQLVVIRILGTIKKCVRNIKF